MRYLALILFFALSLNKSFAQVQPRFSQYMFSQVLFNPAYCGVQDNLSGMLISRNQWTGIEGAPVSQGVNVNQVFKKNAAGLTFLNDRIGVSKNLNIFGIYARKMRFNETTYLSLGLQAGLTSFSESLRGVTTITPGDPAFAADTYTLMSPNCGFGAYFSARSFYMGLSTPSFFYPVGEGISGSRIKFDADYLHYFLTGGYIADLNDNLLFSPSAWLKEVSGAPLQYDLSAVFLYKSSFVALLGYNSEMAAKLGAGYTFNNFKFMYSYDFTFSALSREAGSTHEISLEWGFPFYSSPLTKFAKRKYLDKKGRFMKQ